MVFGYGPGDLAILMTSDARGNGRGGARRSQRHKGPQKPTVRRLGHDRGVKVSAPAVRGIRSGHPWVFRDSVLRQVDGLQPGAPIRILDEDGNSLAWGLYEPDGAIALRVIGYDEDLRWDAEAVDTRVGAALRHRERVLSPQLRTACRLVHADGDGLPGIAVDRLGDFLLVYRYARASDGYVDDLLDSLEARCSPAGIYMQDRVRPVTAEERRPGAAHLRGKTAPPEIEVSEDDLRFIVDVTAPVSPGLFLDLREGRQWVEALGEGKRVLNLFSFTGSFALRALRGGAAAVTNVDAAARSHARCRQNLEASAMDAEACEALTGDVFKHLERMRQRGRRFDLVVVDPPPFSRVKGKLFSALRDWHELLEAIAHVTDPGGEVIAVSNASRLPESELLHAIGAGGIAAGRHVRVLGERGLPPDFPVPPAFVEGHYLELKRLLLP
jgi:23S rRNA (cytosine1962-C5)-methyltransferase